MHLAKADLSIDTIIWLFYGLETLYDTQPGANRRALINRIGLVLSPDDKQRAFLNKEPTELYNIRSGFAHGGRQVAHPMNNEAIDKRVEREYGKRRGRIGVRLRCSSCLTTKSNRARPERVLVQGDAVGLGTLINTKVIHKAS